MAEFVKLSPNEVKFLHEQNPDLVSYNVEFAEVTGGTFWKAYTPEQIAGTEGTGISRPSAPESLQSFSMAMAAVVV